MLNVAVLQGRLVADPELRHTPSDVAVTSFTIAVDRSYVKTGTERQVDFIDIVAWRSNAEFVTKYFRKGNMIIIQGSIQTRSYEDKQGIKRKAFEIVADSIQFAGSKQDSSYSASGSSQSSSYNPSSYSEPTRQDSAPAPAYASGSVDDFEEIQDDDLPF